MYSKKMVALLLASIMVLGTNVENNISQNQGNQSEHNSKNSFYMKSDEIADEVNTDIQEEDYLEIDNELLTEALVEEEQDEDEEYIENLDEMYGEPINEEKGLTTAKIQLASHYNVEIKDFKNIEDVHIENKMLLYDANEVNTYIGYNYRIGDECGYITIAAHTRATLIKEVKEGCQLPSGYEKVYYLSEGEFYFKDNQGYRLLNYDKISDEELEILKKERIKVYYFFTREILANIELDTISMLNNSIYLQEEIGNVTDDALSKSKKYKGQDGTGYGGITDPEKYLKDRYGGTISKSSTKSLWMASFICSKFETEGNCTLVAITRILDYYRKEGYNKIPLIQQDIYDDVLKVAKKYGFTESKGTMPTKINNIIDKVLDNYGYPKSYSKGIYVWNFKENVKKEIDKDRPVIMNIARGYYGGHTVTVCGYGIYKSKHKMLIGSYKKTHNLIQVYDGWECTKRYIDYEAFAFDLISSGFGSFNTVIMKK